MQLLLLSNCTNPRRGYLEHALPEMLAFLHEVTELTFVPFAGGNLDEYTAMVRSVFEPHGIAVRGLHEAADPVAAVAAAQALFVGGGNTFRLLAALQRKGLLPVIRARVQNDLPYVGSSAGTIIVGPSIRTTNDMPIVQPESFDALGLLPFQLNPHYVDTDPAAAYGGETREERLIEFLDENNVPVLGLREGALLSVTSSAACALAVVSNATDPGTADSSTAGSGSAGHAATEPAILFERGRAPRNLGGDVSALLASRPRYDRPLADAVS